MRELMLGLLVVLIVVALAAAAIAGIDRPPGGTYLWNAIGITAAFGSVAAAVSSSYVPSRRS